MYVALLYLSSGTTTDLLVAAYTATASVLDKAFNQNIQYLNVYKILSA